MDKETNTIPSSVDGHHKLKIVGIAILAVIIGLSLYFLPVKESLQSVLVWTQEVGFWGYLVVIIFYMIASILFLPGSIMTLAAGFLFGVLAGFIVVSIGSTLGATAAFLTGRFLARDSIEKWIASNPKFNSIDKAVAKQGFKIVVLTRLSPIFPFNMLNYAFGLTKVSLWNYVLGSWLGMIPGTVLYVYLGSTANDLAQIFTGGIQNGMAQNLLKILGLFATIIITVYVTRIARNTFKKHSLNRS